MPSSCRRCACTTTSASGLRWSSQKACGQTSQRNSMPPTACMAAAQHGGRRGKGGEVRCAAAARFCASACVEGGARRLAKSGRAAAGRGPSRAPASPARPAGSAAQRKPECSPPRAHPRLLLAHAALVLRAAPAGSGSREVGHGEAQALGVVGRRAPAPRPGAQAGVSASAPQPPCCCHTHSRHCWLRRLCATMCHKWACRAPIKSQPAAPRHRTGQSTNPGPLRMASPVAANQVAAVPADL